MKKTMIKKIAAVAMILVIAATVMTAFMGCKQKGSGRELKFAIPDGAPLLAVADMATTAGSFVTDNVSEDEPYTVKYDILTGAQVQSKLINNLDYDIALAPINTCAIAYNNHNGEYILGGVAVWGLNHIITTETGTEFDSLDRLKGETVYAFQQSGTPGLTLKEVLKRHNIDYVEGQASAPSDKVNILWNADPAAVINKLVADNYSGNSIKYAFLSEPLATAQVNSNPDKLKFAFDIQKYWGTESYPQVGLLIKKSLAGEDSKLVDKIISRMSASCTFVRENAAETANKAIADLESSYLPEEAANVTSFLNNSGQQAFLFKDAKTAKSAVNDYLTALHASTPTVVGGSVPGDAFYYGV